MRDVDDGGGWHFDAARFITVAAPLLGLGAFALLSGGKKGSQTGAQELAVWKLLITAQVVAWTAFAGAGNKGLGELNTLIQHWSPRSPGAGRKQWRKDTVRFLALTYGVIVLLLILGGVAGLRNPYLIPGQEWKIPLFHVVAGATALPFFIALKRIQLSAAEDQSWSTTAGPIVRIQILRRCLRTATAALGTTIALAVIATGVLRNAVKAANLVPLPESFVVIYGAWFTGVLAAVYLYVFTALERRARSIMEKAAPLPSPNLKSAEAFASSVELRKQLSQELELGGDPRKNLEGLVAVLSPLAGALLSDFGGLGS